MASSNSARIAQFAGFFEQLAAESDALRAENERLRRLVSGQQVRIADLVAERDALRRRQMVKRIHRMVQPKGVDERAVSDAYDYMMNLKAELPAGDYAAFLATMEAYQQRR